MHLIEIKKHCAQLGCVELHWYKLGLFIGYIYFAKKITKLIKLNVQIIANLYVALHKCTFFL